MKKSILILLIFCASAALGLAQINKGSIFAGLDLNLSSTQTQNSFSQSSSSNTSASQTSVLLMPGLGYFISEDLVVGISFGYSGNYTQDLINHVTESNAGLNFSPFVRNYFNIGEKAALFTQFNIGYTTTWGTKGNIIGPSDQSNGYILGVSISPGLSYFISDKFELEAAIALLGYTNTSNKTIPGSGADTQTYQNSNFQLNLTMSAINFGFKYYLRKS